MPGIIDCHVHVFSSFGKGEPAHQALLRDQAPGQRLNLLRAGGTILLPETRMGQLGRICLFRDSEGNTVDLLASK